MTALELAPEDPALRDFKRLCTGACRVEEAGHIYFHLPSLALGDNVQPPRCDALLRVTPGDGYPSRLFLADRVKSRKKLNWNGEAFILQRKWYAFSWKVDAEYTGLRLLTAHLRAFR